MSPNPYILPNFHRASDVTLQSNWSIWIVVLVILRVDGYEGS
ncbi:hypothetical protein [Paenarthrobacter nitroguajacolicus]